MELFELLHNYHDEPHIEEGLYELLEDDENNSIIWGLIHALHLLDDKMVKKDYVDGFVDGILSVFAPCPISEEFEGVKRTVRSSPNCKTERFAVNLA